LGTDLRLTNYGVKYLMQNNIQAPLTGEKQMMWVKSRLVIWVHKKQLAALYVDKVAEFEEIFIAA